MSDNNTRDLAVGLKFTQQQKNCSHHAGINQTPYKALFGEDPKIGLISFSLPADILQRLQSEDDLIALCYPSTDTNQPVQTATTSTNQSPPTATTTNQQPRTTSSIQPLPTATTTTNQSPQTATTTTNQQPTTTTTNQSQPTATTTNQPPRTTSSSQPLPTDINTNNQSPNYCFQPVTANCYYYQPAT
ncbi:hypothetical protein DPMN_186302 [Dreissena polymorpha]|uniref:Uncharacterized protein n=1 Tax=Dreissena polymorpha TaxID=45954 RepID=A0A9D4I985_DREPO|nr:hypothetical protein DPMN_186302 [Dreissena polymorpha]